MTMSSEVEITVRVMTPREGQDPLYTAEKFLDVGDLSEEGFRHQLMGNTHILISRAANGLDGSATTVAMQGVADTGPEHKWSF